ncbi:LysM peptidoglycan-binding domain-containing protein [Octadecabacter sp.]|nr:LysM peptidoglycan-binding domain-containing protein [Octadecabacter sp.]
MDQTTLNALASVSNTCSAPYLSPMIVADGVTTLGEMEVIEFLSSTVQNGDGLLIDAHLPVAAGGSAPAAPEATPENTQGMEVRVVQRATDAVQARFYTVQSGDSLGAISITFFGSSDYYDVIFQANKDLLSSPDRIRAGQRLVIPQLDA